MEKKWEIKNKAKWLYVIIYLFMVFITYYWLVSTMTIRQGGDFEENFRALLILFFPVTVILLIVPPYWILRKKIPKAITVNAKENYIALKFNAKKTIYYDMNEICFSLSEYQFYSLFVFYEKLRAKRGHIVYKKILSIVGLPVSFSWTSDKLKSLESALREIRVEELKRDDKDSFLPNLTE